MDDYADETLEERINEYVERQNEEYGKQIEIISITYGNGKHKNGLYTAFREIDASIKDGSLYENYFGRAQDGTDQFIDSHGRRK